MKKKIAILGSTGSIGKSTLDVLNKDIKNFDVVLLYANNNYLKLIQQAKKFKPSRKKSINSNIQIFYSSRCRGKQLLYKTLYECF